VINPFFTIARAFRVWWEEWVIMLALNGVWLILQLTVVAGPPATAMVFAMAEKSYDGEYWGPRDAWLAFRRLFWPAWRWGLLNVFLIGVAVVNFLTYRQATAFIWQLLRTIWIITSFLWLTMNLLYWPFWLAQEDKRMRTVYQNCGRFLLINPGPSLVLGLFALLLALVSMASAIPLVAGLMAWLALLGVSAVRQSLNLQKRSG
jgi:uncharacterized membrane protein YesL